MHERPSRHPGTSYHASGADGCHQSHPQDSRRAASEHQLLRPPKCPRPAGRLRVTNTSHHNPSQPGTVSPGCVWRLGMAGCPGLTPSGSARGRRGIILAATWPRKVLCPFFGGKNYLKSNSEIILLQFARQGARIAMWHMWHMSGSRSLGDDPLGP